MELPIAVDVPLPPDVLFERLRHFPRLYPGLHPAHLPHAPGVPVPLLGPDVAFTAAERFGAERRTYAFRVVAFDPAARRIDLVADTVTAVGPLRVRSRLDLHWTVVPAPDGSRLETRQVVTFRPAWLERVLLPAGARRRIAAHAAEETDGARRLLIAPGWPDSGTGTPASADGEPA